MKVDCMPFTAIGSTLDGGSPAICPSSLNANAVSPVCVTSMMCRSASPLFCTCKLCIGTVPILVPEANSVSKPMEARSVRMNGFSGGGLSPHVSARIAKAKMKDMRMSVFPLIGAARRSFLAQVVLLVAFAFSFSACMDEKGQFIFGRVSDKCDTEWPVCDTIAGCLLGDSSYIEG